ncbi:hypothetical protein FE236_06665 [Mariprofundus erugo]|uniref:Uncharacterized protein n=1 Tax=Mariprofundus erugo TaxID=2528639 RepID=A0A5R9GVY8_9PROT|nr:hypothetical protein [Mariprofundus erugo]TLS67274.1 hypothetical protein FEF65_07515 [Mariprofundus erugo]TLS76528.1 hypothetical protein FE236_06665 [Mariprofundus erugo]
MSQSLIRSLFTTLLCLGATLQAGEASATEGHHVNVITFQNEENLDTKNAYPASFTGSMADLIKSVKEGIEPLMTVHTPHIHPGDVVNLQADVLGSSASNQLEDDGINCQLSYSMEDENNFDISGLCSFFVTEEGADSAQKRNVVIPPHKITVSTAEKGNWILLFHDEKTGAAFYASIER